MSARSRREKRGAWFSKPERRLGKLAIAKTAASILFRMDLAWALRDRDAESAESYRQQARSLLQKMALPIHELATTRVAKAAVTRRQRTDKRDVSRVSRATFYRRKAKAPT
jgi:hypothetical protein